MGMGFWVKRCAMVFSLLFVLLSIIQWLKYNDLIEALQFACIWSAIATGAFFFSRLYQLRKGQQCAICKDSPGSERDQ